VTTPSSVPAAGTTATTAITATTATETGLPGQAGPFGHAPGSRTDHDLTERPGAALAGWTATCTLLLIAAVTGWLVWRAGLPPDRLAGLRLPAPDRPHPDAGGALWSGLLVLAAVGVFVAAGLVRGRPGSVLVLTRGGGYQGSVRRTGLLWISPLLTRRRIDVSLRHWRSRPIDAVDANGTPLQVSVLLVWRVRETARASFAVDDHSRFVREQVEAAVARAAGRCPADDFSGAEPTLRDCELLGDEILAIVAAQCRPVGVEVFAATPVRVDYAPEVAATMRRARVAHLDAKHRRGVLDDVMAVVAEVVRAIGERGLADLDEYERKALVRDLTVAFLSHA
jgi:regulator of protease activity HflC (stomatin/prohibitin superfamily)